MHWGKATQPLLAWNLSKVSQETPGHGTASALAFPSPEDNCRPAVTYPFADPARVPATLQDLPRTDIRLDLRGLLKAGHT